MYQILKAMRLLFLSSKEMYLKNINIGVIAGTGWMIENASGKWEDGDKGSVKKNTLANNYLELYDKQAKPVRRIKTKDRKIKN